MIRRKVLAYVIHRGRLLVLRHPHAPEAGVQVPAGTVEHGEDPDAAVLREAREETGLANLALAGFLGELVTRDAGETHARRFYHLRCDGDPPERWEHWETDPSDGRGPILFAFAWARLPDEAPDLAADQGAMLPALLRALAEDA